MTIINPLDSSSTKTQIPTPSSNIPSTDLKTLTQTKKLGFLSSVKTKLSAFALSVGLVANPMLAENLTLAEKANTYTENTIVFSSTNPLRNKLPGPSLATIQRSIDLMRESYIFKTSSFQYAKDMGLRSLKLHQGECLEMSCAGLVYFLYQKNLQTKVDVYTIKNKNPEDLGGDHAFLVIGRDVNSNPADPSTWGESAVVADPLRNVAFPASQIERLEDHLGLNPQNMPLSRPFNPHQQTLSLWVSNAFTASDLAYLSGHHLTTLEKEELKTLQSHLQDFHGSELHEKRETAQKIFNLLTNVHDEMKELISKKIRSEQTYLMAKLSLYDQMGYFLKSTSA